MQQASVCSSAAVPPATRVEHGRGQHLHRPAGRQPQVQPRRAALTPRALRARPGAAARPPAGPAPGGRTCSRPLRARRGGRQSSRSAISVPLPDQRQRQRPQAADGEPAGSEAGMRGPLACTRRGRTRLHHHGELLDRAAPLQQPPAGGRRRWRRGASRMGGSAPSQCSRACRRAPRPPQSAPRAPPLSTLTGTWRSCLRCARQRS